MAAQAGLKSACVRQAEALSGVCSPARTAHLNRPRWCEVGSDLHVEYEAAGRTIHLARRMEQLATPTTTRLTPGTLALVEGYVRVRSLGPVPIKGLPAPIELFELLSAGPSCSRLHKIAHSGLRYRAPTHG